MDTHPDRSIRTNALTIRPSRSPCLALLIFRMKTLFFFCLLNIRFLQTENLEHCVPSSVSSGLASLPLSHVYVKGNQTAQTTSKQLPSGEPLNGTKAYESILPYFTTISKTPDQVHQLGKEMLWKLYPEVK